MGILQNGYRDTVGVFRTYGGTASNNCYPQGTLGNYNLTGAKRNITAGEGITDPLTGVPNGYGMKGWIMPRVGGGMSSRSAAVVGLSAAGVGALGRNMEGAASLSLDGAATGQLIAGAVGTATIGLSGSGSATAVIAAAGTATIGMSGIADIGALGWLAGESTVGMDGSAVSYAIGHMSGTTEDTTTLTPAAISTAVWERAIEAGFTAEQILRILSAVAAGSATGLEGAAPQFVGLDGSTIRVDATYSAGTRTVAAVDGA